MIGHEDRAKLDASFRISREPAIDGLAAILLERPNPDQPRSEFAIRRLAEGAIVGFHGMFVRDIPVPRFVEDLGRYLFGITDGADQTLIDILAYMEKSLRSSIPQEIRNEFDNQIACLCMRMMFGWMQRRERVGVGDSIVEKSPDNAEVASRDIGSLLQSAVEQSPIGVYVTEFSSAEPIVNNNAHQQMFGYSMAEELALEPDAFQDQEIADDDFDLLADLIEGRIPYLERISARPHKDGHSVPFHLLAWPIRNDAGDITHFFNLISPETRPGVTAGSGLAEKRARYLLRLSPDPVVITTEGGEIRYASPSVGSILGYDPDVLIGEPIDRLFAADSMMAGRLMMEDVGRASLHRVVAEIELLLQNGTSRWFELVATNLLVVDDVQGIVLQGRDVTERRALQGELERAARVDPLTGLLNRRGFLERLQAWLDAHAMPLLWRSSVGCYVDLDTFKSINDRHGHGAGDAVLMEIGSRLARLTDNRGFAGRIGGDEFVLLVEMVDETELAQFGDDLVAALHGTVLHGNEQIAFSGSAGLVELRDMLPIADAMSILLAADENLTREKAERRMSMETASETGS